MNKDIIFLQPVCTHNIWGGTRLNREFGYSIEGDDIGECWGISAHPSGDGTVRNGAFQGMKLSELWKKHPELFGDTGMERFPLLVKIIDAKDDLSIQVHPNDAYAKYFSGRSFLAPVSTDQVPIFNVTFEPGCRNNWHIHHASNGGGQILICVAGRGYYQEEGKEAIEMRPGDCINIKPGVKHWHGAAKDEWFSHLAVEVPGIDTYNEWCEPVSDDDYNQLK